MFPFTRPHISWLKIRDSSDAAVEEKALDKQNEATTSVLTTKEGSEVERSDSRTAACKYTVTLRRIFLRIPRPCRYDMLPSSELKVNAPCSYKRAS